MLLWVVAFGWALLPTPWLMWWVVVRGRLPVLPLIGEPNGGPFYLNYSHAVFVVLLAAAFVLGLVQVWVGWLLWNGERSGALLQFALLPVEAVFWYGFDSHSAIPRSSPRHPRGVGLATIGLKPHRRATNGDRAVLRHSRR